ncbi:hypothetical protein GJ496_009536 [Pomphorhynchus laevis]|nr:hypothetical protein GJ496_009536 [Pomphorhynchus laevis]
MTRVTYLVTNGSALDCQNNATLQRKVSPLVEDSECEQTVTKHPAIAEIATAPIILVENNSVASTGGGVLGHPIKYLNLELPEVKTCGYSGRRFIQKKFYNADIHGPAISLEEYNRNQNLNALSNFITELQSTCKQLEAITKASVELLEKLNSKEETEITDVLSNLNSEKIEYETVNYDEFIGSEHKHELINNYLCEKFNIRECKVQLNRIDVMANTSSCKDLKIDKSINSVTDLHGTIETIDEFERLFNLPDMPLSCNDNVSDRKDDENTENADENGENESNEHVDTNLDENSNKNNENSNDSSDYYEVISDTELNASQINTNKIHPSDLSDCVDLLQEVKARIKLDELLDTILSSSNSTTDDDDVHSKKPLDKDENRGINNSDSENAERLVVKESSLKPQKNHYEPLLCIPIDPRDLPSRQKLKKRKLLRSQALQLSSSYSSDSSTEELSGNFSNLKLKKRSRYIEINSADESSDIETYNRGIKEKTLLDIVLPKCPDGNRHDLHKPVVLDYDKDTKKTLIDIDPAFLKYLRPHQIEGIRFMWDCCFESVEKIETEKGRGCILSHCMGLGKTLQVIVFINSLMRCENITRVKHVLILVPKNTIKNWLEEFYRWQLCLSNDDDKITTFELSDSVRIKGRLSVMRQWKSKESKAVLIVGYEQFRCLTETFKKAKHSIVEEVLHMMFTPGPDILVCDEGHVLRNNKTSLFKCVSQISTPRKIILTGTPLQNSLDEYHCMVSLVSPKLLGEYKDFKHRFVLPINKGMLADSTESDVKLMKKRVHVLHSMLDEVILRKDYKYLMTMLPPKYEYILSIRPSDLQKQLYLHYLSQCVTSSYSNTSIFKDNRTFGRILVHPWLCKMYSKIAATTSDDSSDYEEESYSDDCSETSKELRSSLQTKSVKKTSISNGNEIGINTSDPEAHSNWCKIVLAFDIMDACWTNNEKLVIFSQSLLALDYIELLLSNQIKSNTDSSNHQLSKDTWVPNVDYVRIDGFVSCKSRDKLIRRFNDENNRRLRLFLISTKAGGIGINLCAANRAIIFDVSWNPAHDMQSIFRLYRIGQSQPVYIYRFIAQGSIEEKIYQRQVNKESLTMRVCDERHLERHFTSADLSELYIFNPQYWDPSVSIDKTNLPKDSLLSDLIQKRPEWIVRYHEHDSLLQKDDDLTEEERIAALSEYEQEKFFQENYIRDQCRQYHNTCLMNIQSRVFPSSTSPMAGRRLIHPDRVQLNYQEMAPNPNPNQPRVLCKRIVMNRSYLKPNI